MKFVEILQAIYDTYNVDACYVADNLQIEDDVVLKWETTELVPSDEELKKFSELFAIPLKTLQNSL